MSSAGVDKVGNGEHYRTWRVGVAASPSLRRGPSSPLAQLLREIEPSLRYLGAEIYALQGSLHAIIRCGLLRTLPPEHIHAVPPGRLGGLVDVGAAVVERRLINVCSYFEEDTDDVAEQLGLKTMVDVMIYLLDPYNQTARLPETLALKRECVLKEKPFLATAASAREWFSLHALCAASGTATPAAGDLRATFISDANADRIGLGPRGHQTVALIAHNERKRELLTFALEEKEFLDTFNLRFGTGTSAGVLNRVCGKPGEKCPATDDEMKALVEKVHKEQEEERERAERGEGLPKERGWVVELDSGPRGGDLQSAEAILLGMCDTAIFFEDPSSAHEHDADIEVFERAARVWNLPDRRLQGWGVTCLHDPRSAATWAKLWTAYGGTPTTMAHAFRARYGVDLVMVEPSNGDPEESAWEAVVTEAAWYALSAIMTAGLSRASRRELVTGAAQHLRVVVPPGRGMDDVIRKMSDLVDAPHTATRKHNDRLSDAQREVETILGGRPEAERLIDWARSVLERRRLTTEPDNVGVLSKVLLVAPATGTFGSPVRGIEANVHASALAAIFGAHRVPCAPTVFTAAESVNSTAAVMPPAGQPSDAFELHWDRSDLLFLTCDAADDEFLSDRGQVPMPAGLGKEMRVKEAVGHVAGLFIDDAGKPVESNLYTRCGITADRMLAVAKAARKGDDPESGSLAGEKDSVLIATQDNGRRLATIKAVLEAGYVSTFITDTITARAVLKETRRKVRVSAP